MKEIQGGKYERIEEVNSALRGQIDNYEKLRAESSKEIDRLTAKVKTLDEENDRLFNENCDLRGKLEDAEAKIKEQNRAKGLIVIDGEPPVLVVECSECGQKYFHHVGQSLPNYCSTCGCEFCKPKEVSDELGQS